MHIHMVSGFPVYTDLALRCHGSEKDIIFRHDKTVMICRRPGLFVYSCLILIHITYFALSISDELYRHLAVLLPHYHKIHCLTGNGLCLLHA